MDKSAESYIKMMQMLKEVWPLFNPTTISMDFEQGAIQSALQLFPNAMIAGCLFHLVKNFKKKINRAGLTARYHDPEFSIRARMIMSLAFVPPDNIWRDFEVLRAHLLQYDQALAPVLNWFRRNYVGTAMNPPGFPVNWWSCYERTLTGEDRTNNYAEAAHRRLQDALGVDHPTVGRLLQDLKRIQRNHDTHYEQYLAGQDAPKKRRIYLDADRRILAKVHLYEGANLIEYLRGLAHNIVMDQ
uniref:MULE transposase domain-containing protein n=1 Tax=Ditylenchus dipsaci TaxID=166011 RepID=A0A915CML8_9BILA